MSVTRRRRRRRATGEFGVRILNSAARGAGAGAAWALTFAESGPSLLRFDLGTWRSVLRRRGGGARPLSVPRARPAGS